IEELKKIHLLNSDKKIAIESKINSQGSEYETGKLKLIELDNEINRLSEKIYSLSENIKTGEYKVLDNNGKINNYEFQIKQYNEDSIISENKLIELKNSISGMELELENLEKYFLETEIDKNKVIQELSEIENQSKEIEEQIEKHKIDAFVKSNKISAKKSDLSAIEAENKALKEQKEEIQITIAGSREKIYNLKNEIEILNQNAVQIEKNLNDSRTQTENEIAQKNGIQKHIDILNEKNLEYKNMLMNFKAELKVILDTEDDKYIDGLKDLLKEVSGNKIQIKFHGLVGENIRTSDRYEIAIGNALNEIVQTMIVDSRNDIEKAAGILNANSFGKVKLIEKNIPEEKRRSFENVDFSKEKGFIDFVPNVIKHTNSESKKIINSMFERFAITENFESGYELSREHPEYNFVALSGEIFWSDGSVTAGRVKETRNILKRDRQKNEFENNIRNSAAAIEETNKRIEELNVSLKNSESNIETYLKQSRELDIELLNCKKNIEMKERQLIDLTEDIDKYVEKENSIENKHKELYEKSKEINIQISNYLRETEELNSKANELIQKNNEVKLKRNGLFDSATSVKIKSAEMNQKKENLKQTIVNFKKSAEEFSSKILENKNNCEICLKNSEEIRKENGNIDNKLKESIKEHDINIENRKALQARRENEGGIIANIENLNKNYQKELNEFQNKIHEIEIGLSQKETKTAGIFESVYSRYSISQEDFIGKKWFEKICEELKNEFSGKNVEELKEEVRAVEQKIKSLGPVNINAIEEFKEVSERFEFLNSQKNDLETAEKDLINVINKINARAKEKFIDTFYKVNENFKEIIK
ncbi:MAG TPA: hypothetical protein PLQ81_09925, partial [bacterium]|nr:hypothetical protein [bacterium]